jgi:hypothetical protein
MGETIVLDNNGPCFQMEGIAIVVADFDGVTYHVSNPDERTKTKILISIGMSFFSDLEAHGVWDVSEFHALQFE